MIAPIRTAVVPVEEIFALRWEVLRPGMPRETAVLKEDALPGTFHVAAYDAAGAVAACVTFLPEPLPGSPAAGDATPAYRFRGMGSAASVRGQGYGAAVLRDGLAEARAHGAQQVWCNGRVSARGFYEHQGFTVTGEEFVVEPIGPHYVFVMKLG